MKCKMIRITISIITLSSILTVFSSYSYRKISAKSLRQVERKCHIATIGLGHFTIGDAKVPNLRFEAQGQFTAKQALAHFRSIYWEVMTRTCPKPEHPAIADIVMPGGKSGVKIMIRYSSSSPGLMGNRICKPYMSMVSVHPDGRIIINTYNKKTEKFEKVIETNLATLFGLEGSSEEPPSCKLAQITEELCGFDISSTGKPGANLGSCL